METEKNYKETLHHVGGTKKENSVTREQVYEWTKRDISAASYFLSMLLRYPDIIQGVADELYDRVMDEEQGALIDKMLKDKIEPE